MLVLTMHKQRLGSVLFLVFFGKPQSRFVFVTGNADLDKAFVAAAKAEGLLELKGHRSVGGMRASIYNAMPLAGVEKLVACMAAFEKENL